MQIGWVMAGFISTSHIIKQIVTGVIGQWWGLFPHLWEYCPSAEDTRAIFPQMREINLTIDLDASHYLYNIGLSGNRLSD